MEQLAMEASAAHNSLLTFRGVSPNVGVLGINPRDFFEIDNTTCDAALFDTGPADAATKAASIRHLARAATLQTIAEQRLALAARTRPQQHEPGQFRMNDFGGLVQKPKSEGCSWLAWPGGVA